MRGRRQWTRIAAALAVLGAARRAGRYIFADFGFGTIFSIDATAQGVLQMTDGFTSGLAPSSFGEGLDGELYVVDYGGGGLYHIRQ